MLRCALRALRRAVSPSFYAAVRAARALILFLHACAPERVRSQRTSDRIAALDSLLLSRFRYCKRTVLHTDAGLFTWRTVRSFHLFSAYLTCLLRGCCWILPRLLRHIPFCLNACLPTVTFGSFSLPSLPRLCLSWRTAPLWDFFFSSCALSSPRIVPHHFSRFPQRNCSRSSTHTARWLRRIYAARFTQRYLARCTLAAPLTAQQ